MIELVEPLQGTLEDPDEQRAFLAELAMQNIVTLEQFLLTLHSQAHR